MNPPYSVNDPISAQETPVSCSTPGEGVQLPPVPENPNESPPSTEKEQCPEPESSPAPCPVPVPVVPGNVTVPVQEAAPAQYPLPEQPRRTRRRLRAAEVGNLRTTCHDSISRMQRVYETFKTNGHRDNFRRWLGQELTEFCCRNWVDVAVKDGRQGFMPVPFPGDRPKPPLPLPPRVPYSSVVNKLELDPPPSAPLPPPVVIEIPRVFKAPKFAEIPLAPVLEPAPPPVLTAGWPVTATVSVMGLCPNPRLVAGYLVEEPMPDRPRRVSMHRAGRNWRSGEKVTCRLTQPGGTPIYTPV